MTGELTQALGTCTNNSAANTDAKVDRYGTVRGRVGWTAGPVLFYGTGGLAYGTVDLRSNLNVDFLNGSTPGSLNSQTSPLRTGWVAGGGFEYMLRPNLRLGVGYQHVDLGTVSLASSAAIPSGAGTVGMAQSANVHAAFQVVSASLNWQFSPTNAAAPWEGFYLGGHAGGAWGDRTSADYSGACNSCIPLISDVRLKRDIVLVGHMNDGLGIYGYRYLWSDTVYVGVMAQEVALIHPDAVVRSPLDDYLRVNYSKLGLKLMTQTEWDAFARGTGSRSAVQKTAM